MAYTPMRDEIHIANAALQLLIRDTMLAGTVWRNPVVDFARKKNETVSLYLPAYLTANKRTLRANAVRQRSSPKERKVDVVLDSDLQIDVALSDENQTLDVRSLVADVVAPAIGGIVRGYDEELAALMQGATYENEVSWDSNDPYPSLLEARRALNDASVPANGRFLVVGSGLEQDLLASNRMSNANTAGDNSALRRASIGTVAGFEVLTSQFLEPDVGFAYHTTAYALCSRAPVVPDGVAWGAVQSQGGFAIRVMQHLAQDDNKDLLNFVYHDSWFGASVVTDNGSIDSNGKFIPSVDPDDGGEDDLFVRAVKLGDVSSS